MAGNSSLSIPVLELRGSAEERGRAYGEGCRDAIHNSLQVYEESFWMASGASWQEVRHLAESWRDRCEDFAPEIMREIYGVARGAGVSVEDVVALNCRREIIDARRRVGVEEFSSKGGADEGCSSFALLPEFTGGHVFAGQNWDWKSRTKGTIVLLRIVPDEGPTVLMHVEAGQIGRQGANSSGLALNANGLYGPALDGVGIPQAFIRRKVLGANNLEEAISIIERTEQQISSNALITYKHGFAIDFETTPGSHGWMYPERGLIVHGNHYQAFVPPSIANTHRVRSPSSLYRVWQIEQKLRQSVKPGANKQQILKATRFAMADHMGYPGSVCEHPASCLPEWERSQTILSSLVDLTSGDYYVTAGNPCLHPYELAPWNLYEQ